MLKINQSQGFGVISSTGAGYDTDAQAFFNATGIIDVTIKDAVNTFVVFLKTNGIWTKMLAIWPMVGGTATTHKFNLKNPLDTDAAFRLTYGTGITHSTAGLLANGDSTAWADTKFNPNTHHGTEWSLGLKLSAVGAGTSTRRLFGASDGAADTTIIRPSTGNNNTTYQMMGNSTSPAVAVVGFHICNKAIGVGTACYRDGTSVGTVAAGSNRVNASMGLGKVSTTLLAGINNTVQFAFFGNLLTTTDITNLNSAVSTLQTALGR